MPCFAYRNRLNIGALQLLASVLLHLFLFLQLYRCTFAFFLKTGLNIGKILLLLDAELDDLVKKLSKASGLRKARIGKPGFT